MSRPGVPLATHFALECLRRFVAGEMLGASVRAARLALLAESNPLGLIYVSFAMPQLRLVAHQAAVHPPGGSKPGRPARQAGGSVGTQRSGPRT
jgi:hypothetical protein